ncbi:hypothetical protein [Solitalea koreensis]|uniref:Uncharacterized protein n=1 Tax=Solitalea koreensis TaxID=543615 RepID=A0A521AZP2_9SPHI|nr:hypothetical protein [Solitalea koreensis]SMO40307.1 hypothetical protein SAMN06265350_101554 [Solitalea koreensis]
MKLKITAIVLAVIVSLQLFSYARLVMRMKYEVALKEMVIKKEYNSEQDKAAELKKVQDEKHSNIIQRRVTLISLLVFSSALMVVLFRLYKNEQQKI